MNCGDRLNRASEPGHGFLINFNKKLIKDGITRMPLWLPRKSLRAFRAFAIPFLYD